MLGLVYLWVIVLTCSRVAGAEERHPSAAEIGSVQVYLTPGQARQKIFPGAADFAVEVRPIPAALKAGVEKELGRVFDEDSLEVYIAFDQDRALLGYAIISEEIGKYRPITFMVGITADFKVGQVAVLVYRESRGSEVRRSRFLRQYRGKSPADPIRINRDIINVTGATMSVRALNFGVKKVLILTKLLYSQAAVHKTP